MRGGRGSQHAEAVDPAPSALDAQVATNNPFLPGRHLSAFVQQTVLPMPVKQEHADFELCDDRRGRCFALGWRIGVEDRLTAFAASRG